MPVVFEQPDPIGAFPSQGMMGGYVAQYDKDREYQLQADSLNANIAGGNANRLAQSQQHQQAAQLAGQQMQARAQVTPAEQFQAQRQQAILAQQGQQQQALQAQHGQQQMQAQAAQFTQADRLRLAQLQQADSFIDQQATSGNWSPEEIQQAKASVHGVMGPLQMKMEQAKTQAATQKAQVERQDAIDRAAHTKTYLQFMAGNPKGYATDEETGILYGFKPDGTIQFHNPPKEAVDKSAEQDFKEDQHFADVRMKLLSEALKHVKQTTGEGALAKTTGFLGPEEVDDFIDRQMRNSVGAASVAEKRANKAAGITSGMPPGEQYGALKAHYGITENMPPEAVRAKFAALPPDVQKRLLALKKMVAPAAAPPPPQQPNSTLPPPAGGTATSQLGPAGQAAAQQLGVPPVPQPPGGQGIGDWLSQQYNRAAGQAGKGFY